MQMRMSYRKIPDILYRIFQTSMFSQLAGADAAEMEGHAQSSDMDPPEFLDRSDDLVYEAPDISDSETEAEVQRAQENSLIRWRESSLVEPR